MYKAKAFVLVNENVSELLQDVYQSMKNRVLFGVHEIYVYGLLNSSPENFTQPNLWVFVFRQTSVRLNVWFAATFLKLLLLYPHLKFFMLFRYQFSYRSDYLFKASLSVQV